MKSVELLFRELAIDTCGIKDNLPPSEEGTSDPSSTSSWEDWIGGSLIWNSNHTGVNAFMSYLLPTKDCFFSGVYLWSANTIRGEVVRKGAISNDLFKFGLLAIGASMSGETIFLDIANGDVYWSHRIFYDFDESQIVYCDSGRDRFLPLSRESLRILLTYIGDLNEEFLLAWMKDRYIKLFKILDENWIQPSQSIVQLS